MNHSERKVYESIDHILNKGAAILYDEYLQTKLPYHTYQISQPQFYSTIDIANTKAAQKSSLGNCIQPKSLNYDNILKNKIKIKKVPTSVISFPQKLSYSSKNNIKTSRKTNISESITKKRNHSTHKITNKKPFIKLLTYKNKQAQQDAQLLSDLISRRKKQKNNLIEAEQAQKKENNKKNNAIQSYRQLKKRGNIIYGFDGKMVSGNRKNSQSQYDDFLKLDYFTTQRCWGNPQRQTLLSQVSGRKRGYTSCQKRTKKKVSNQQFNNNEMRQISSIPFVTIEGGSKLTEKQKDVFIEKVSQFQTKQNFDKQLEKTGFKSFSTGRNQPSMRATMSCRDREDDKLTTFNTLPANTTKIWFRTKTGKQKNGRITINDQDLAKNMCYGS